MLVGEPVAGATISIEEISAGSFARLILPASNFARLSNVSVCLASTLGRARCWKIAGGTVIERADALERICSSGPEGRI